MEFIINYIYNDLLFIVYFIYIDILNISITFTLFRIYPPAPFYDAEYPGAGGEGFKNEIALPLRGGGPVRGIFTIYLPAR